MCCGGDIPPIRDSLVTSNKNSSSFVLYIAEYCFAGKLHAILSISELRPREFFITGFTKLMHFPLSNSAYFSFLHSAVSNIEIMLRSGQCVFLIDEKVKIPRKILRDFGFRFSGRTATLHLDMRKDVIRAKLKLLAMASQLKRVGRGYVVKPNLSLRILHSR